jgi:hypothetical protein
MCGASRGMSVLTSRRSPAEKAWRAVELHEPDEGRAIEGQCLECLDRCLQELKPNQRELVVEYHGNFFAGCASFRHVAVTALPTRAKQEHVTSDVSGPKVDGKQEE